MDTVKPTVTVNALTTNNNKPTLTGTVSDAAPSSGLCRRVTVVVGGQTLTATVTGTTWSVAVPAALADGTYDVQVTATDNAGNVGSDTTTNELIVDTVSPAVTVTNAVRRTTTNRLERHGRRSGAQQRHCRRDGAVGAQTLPATVTGTNLERGGAHGAGRRDL